MRGGWTAGSGDSRSLPGNRHRPVSGADGGGVPAGGGDGHRPDRGLRFAGEHGTAHCIAAMRISSSLVEWPSACGKSRYGHKLTRDMSNLRNETTSVIVCGDRVSRTLWELIVRPGVQQPSRGVLSHASPLFEKELHSRSRHFSRSERAQRASSGRAPGPLSPPTNHPVNLAQIDQPKVLEKRLTRPSLPPDFTIIEIARLRSPIPAR